MNKKKLVIAMDGPAGAGKSTVARLVAKKMNYTYIDTGSMYRAVAWKVLKEDKGASKTAILDVLKNIQLQLKYGNDKVLVFMDEFDITEQIRTPEVTGLVSKVAQIGEVRAKMVNLQQNMALNGGVVMDGRDICTHVLPNAEIKVFLTASIEERAMRRWKELKNKGYEIGLKELQLEIAARDKADSEREISPLIQAKDAVLIDTTNMSIHEAVDSIIKLCERA
ncbi:(d)CMP kinase [Anaerosinus gibii]|uniref:Cytidylate kinase n=1 Tax=Selenobaculum gibii TaxID=3054208 RepID=A0A9Y2AHQ8_9FIRM|nr:(d)CMP kinase [Selenobaculum gbiensis]WIW69630.1 (d)CMP kinase [Selenobaculum gbiensis]